MLSRPVTENTIVVETDELLEVAKTAGLNAIKMPGEQDPVDFGDNLVIVIDDENGEFMAMSLAESGVNPKKVEWIDKRVCPGGVGLFLSDPGKVANINGYCRDIYWSQVRTLHEAEDDPALQERIPSGFEFLDPHLQWRRRELVVACGPYGCGKSMFTQLLAVKWCLGEGAKYPEGDERVPSHMWGMERQCPVMFCTWEDDEQEQKDQIRRHFPGRPDLATKVQKMIRYVDPEYDGERYLSHFMKQARYMNEKFGTNFFLCDPWSEFDHERAPRELETEYVKAVMKQLGRLAIELNAIIIVVTHITKSKYSDDNVIKPFRVSDSMGSVQFGSTATRGFCVLRTSCLVGNQDHMIVHFDKIKIERNMGKKGTLALLYDEDRHTLFKDHDATSRAADMWKGKQPDDNKSDSSGTSSYGDNMGMKFEAFD